MAEAIHSPVVRSRATAWHGRVPGVAWLLIGLVLFFSASAPGFFSGANLQNVALQATVLLMLALPMTLVILTEGLDLSMGALLSLCTVVLAVVQIATGSILLGFGAAMAMALLFGLVNGVLVASFELPPFVVTLGTLGAAQGLALVVAEDRTTMGVADGVRQLWEGHALGLPLPVWLALGVWGALHLLLNHSRF